MRPEHLRGADALRRALDDSCRQGQALVLCSTHDVVRATVLQASLELRARMDVRSSRKLAEWLTSLVGYDTLVLIEPTQHRRKDDEHLKKLLAGSKVKFVTVTDRSFAPQAQPGTAWTDLRLAKKDTRHGSMYATGPNTFLASTTRGKLYDTTGGNRTFLGEVTVTPRREETHVCIKCDKKQECSHVSCPNRKPLTAFAPYHPDEKPELPE